MIDILRKQIGGGHTREEKVNHLREFLQILILKIIYDTGYYKNLSFVGGTALRVLYDLLSKLKLIVILRRGQERKYHS